MRHEDLVKGDMYWYVGSNIIYPVFVLAIGLFRRIGNPMQNNCSIVDDHLAKKSVVVVARHQAVWGETGHWYPDCMSAGNLYREPPPGIMNAEDRRWVDMAKKSLNRVEWDG